MTTATMPAPYPARLTGRREPQISRWLWLVKMFLATPHFVLLAGLGVAFVVTTVCAGFAILFTGRYPRALFDFNVGIMRWNWRVGFYVYAALGTDRYPPFTLSKTDYPADFDVDYPERLSRGLVLIKSWLLAVPHLIIGTLVVADVLLYPWSGSAVQTSGAAGAYSVLNLLVFIAGAFLLITGVYPRPLFDFVIGVNRWLYRVVTYVALMRDEYPPFRLDTGPTEVEPVPSRAPAPGLPPRDDASAVGGATRFLTRAEGRIAYDVRGTGPIVLMVPGMGDLRSAYRFLTGPLVEAGHTVVTTDLRGHGDSDCTFSQFGDGPTAGDLEALLEHLGAPAVVVGNSMAAGAAVILAAERPELVSGLVLVGPFVRRPASDTFLGRLILRFLMARPWAATMWRAYLPKLFAGTVPADFEDHRRRVVASIRRPGYSRAFSLTTRTRHLDAAASIGRVHAPTLVIMGEQDPDFPSPEVEAEWIADALHGHAVMIPGAGHYPQSQQPDFVAAAVVEFLSKVRAHG